MMVCQNTFFFAIISTRSDGYTVGRDCVLKAHLIVDS